MVKKGANQTARFITMLVYCAILLGISEIAIGYILPPTSEKGLWLYAGLASLLLGYILTNPFYTPPADSFTNGVAALISLITVNVFVPKGYSFFDKAIWILVLLFSVLVLLSSSLAIIFKDAKSDLGSKLGKICYIISSKWGNPKIIFSGIYLFALVVFHRNNPREFLWIGIAWALLVAFQPIENTLDLIGRLKNILGSKSSTLPKFGEIVGHQSPNILLIRHDPDETLPFATPIVVHAEDGKLGAAISIDYMGYAEGRWLRAYRLIDNILADAFTGLEELPMLGAYRFNDKDPNVVLGQNAIWQRRKDFIGIVAPESDVAKLRIDIAGSNRDIQVGRLLEVQTDSQPILYQVINGLTKEEAIQQKNTRGYIRADAKKIGTWDAEQGRFQVAKWLPQPNSPIFLVDASPVDPIRDAVGFFPGTDYPVRVEDIDRLITHNTAILGILGIGKSFLAFELVERMIEHGAKVICLDITNQYAQHLAGLFDPEKQKKAIEWLHQNEHGPDGRNNFQKVREEGGSALKFKEALAKLITKFLDPKNVDDRFLIVNPAEYEVWRQDGNMYKDTEKPPMAQLTPVEITRLITEVVLEILQSQGITENARCCLVFEEAHSLIPEWNSVVNDGDKSATNGIAKAILQGRKYGLGCLVITQRTANVTKSVLNQCNTVFALRLFDSTGMEFLRNYVGEDYSSVLSTLDDRHAVFFGRASSCKDPVLIRLNDRDKFLAAFRKAKPEKMS